MTELEMICAARAEYARRYRAAHPEKAKAAQARYWKRKAAEMIAQAAEDKQDEIDEREVSADAGK